MKILTMFILRDQSVRGNHLSLLGTDHQAVEEQGQGLSAAVLCLTCLVCLVMVQTLSETPGSLRTIKYQPVS